MRIPFVHIATCCVLSGMFIANCFGLAPVGTAEQAPILSMDEAVEQAINKNPRLTAASRDVLAAELGVRSARALPNPEIIVTPGLTGHGSDEELLVRLPLELNGARGARAAVAGAHLRRQRAEAVVELRRLVFDTKTAYITLFQAKERLALAREAQKLAEEFDRIARLQVDAGARPGIDVTQTEIEVALARQQVHLAIGGDLSATAELNTLMGRTVSQPVGALALPTRAAQTLDAVDLKRRALADRAEIEAAEAQSELFRQEGRLARAEGRPDLAPQVRAESLSRGLRTLGVGLGITLPLIDFGGRRSRVWQAEETARAQTDRAEGARRLVQQEVDQAIAHMRAAENVLTSYEHGVLTQSRKLLDAALIGFREGKTSLVAALEAQRTYRNVQNEHLAAQAHYAVTRAELERATGTVAARLLPVVGRPASSKNN